LALIWKLYGRPHWPRPLAKLLPLMRSGLVFVLMSIFLVGANNIDALLLSRLGSIAEVGLYGAAFKLVQAVIIFRPILMRSLFPSMVQAAASPTQLQQLAHHTLRTLFMLMAPLPVLLFFLAQPLILLLYGPEFSEATWVLQVLSWSILLSFLAVALHRVILAADEERAALKISIVAMIVNVGMDLALIPRLGAQGAAIASLLSLSASLLISWWWVAHRLFPVTFGPVAGKPALGLVLAAALAFLVDLGLPSYPWVSAFAFVASYPWALVLVGALSQSELESLWTKAHFYWTRIYEKSHS
jgi:O-antigen/teichoic acid export membrane protein